MRNRQDHVDAVQATVEAFGSLNVSINNAGVNKPLFFMDITEENYDFIMDINVRGALLGMQEQARQMIKQGKQKEPYKILHVASILSRETFDDVVIYGASKHAVAGLIKGGAKGLAEYGIVDFELGNKVTGAGFPFYKGAGARLQRALINYFLNFFFVFNQNSQAKLS